MMSRILKRIMMLGLLGALAGCFYGTTYEFANLSEPHENAIPGFGGEYVYSIAFSLLSAGGAQPLPIEAAEGRDPSSFRLSFAEKDFRRDVNLSVTLSPIRFTNLQTGQVYTTHNKIRGNNTDRIFTISRPDLPLGDYQIDFSGRFCANGVCKNFSQSLQRTLFLDRAVFTI